MNQYLAYGLMLLVIAVLCLINWRHTRPTLEAGDRFGLLFLEARDYAVGVLSARPLTREDGEGRLYLMFPEGQPAHVRAMLTRGTGEEMARYDRELEAALRALFATLGKSQHVKTHYFDYYNTFFILHRLFLAVCADPGAALTREAWVDLERYTADRAGLVDLLSRRMSGAGRRTLSGRRAEQPQGKEGMDETL